MFIIFDNYNQPTLFTNLQIYCDLNCCSLVTWIYHHKAGTLHQNLVPNLSEGNCPLGKHYSPLKLITVLPAAPSNEHQMFNY